MERRGAHPETTEIARALVSMVFPCQKDELIRHAAAHQADAAVLAALESMPEGTYASMADVLQRFAVKRENAWRACRCLTRLLRFDIILNVRHGSPPGSILEVIIALAPDRYASSSGLLYCDALLL
jgi:hypothetical protein